MSSPTSSSTRVVYTLYGPKTVDKSDQHPFGSPVPGTPVFRQTFPTSQDTWSLDDIVTPIHRRSHHSSGPYARSHRSAQIPSNSATGSYVPSWRDTRCGCMERIHFELSAISAIETNAIGAVERERERYKLAVTQRNIRRVIEERDVFREKIPFKTSSSWSSLPSNCNEFVQIFSSAGPLRRNSISRSFLRAEHISNSYSRCKIVDPYLLPKGINDCFDVTLVGRSLPPQREHRQKSDLEPSSPNLIRDASFEESRQCYPLSKIGEIDFDHVDILYIPYNGRVFCRACHVNQHKTQNFATIEVENFPNNASWDDLRNHYLLMHPSESQEIATLTVPQIIELRERLQDKRTSL